MTLIVAGALHLDVVVRAPRLPAKDETLTGDRVDYVFGGKGGNQAVAAARMGAETGFIGRTGSDGFGHTLRHTLAAAGVDISQLQTDPGASGMSAAIVDQNGDYGAVIVSAANLNIDGSRAVLPAGTGLLLLQNEIPEAINIALARKAAGAHIPVWLNAAPARPLSPELTACVDLLIVNRVEASFYAGHPGLPETLETRGPEGVHWRGVDYPACPTEVHSTHGAGDMFAGALAARVLQGADTAEAVRFAQAAAALHISTPLPGRGSIDRAQVEQFMRSQSSR